jgi:hypothetical protein
MRRTWQYGIFQDFCGLLILVTHLCGRLRCIEGIWDWGCVTNLIYITLYRIPVTGALITLQNCLPWLSRGDKICSHLFSDVNLRYL